MDTHRVVEGTVLEILPRALYRVGLAGGGEVTAHAVTGARRSFIRLLVGDCVQVELSSRDLGRGRIIGRR